MENPAVLSLRKVNKIYGKGDAAVHAAKDIELEARAGEVTLIMGPSGSGKTTLLSMSGVLLRPTSGEIIIDDQDITKLSERQLAKIRLKNIGFVFQAFNLLASLTVLENVEFSYNLLGIRGKKAREGSTDILNELGLGKRLRHYPDEISGGEKQRVALARALAAKPKLILADEPTGNLDSKSGHQVVGLLQQIAKERKSAVVVVSHDMRIMDIADRMLWLEDGMLSEDGFKMTVDPVCGMKLRKDETTHSVVYNNEEYYFCSEIDKKKFKSSPQKFI